MVAEQNKPGLTPEYDPHVQLFLTINVPEVLAELRTKRLALDRETLPNSSSAAFAFVNVFKQSIQTQFKQSIQTINLNNQFKQSTNF